MTGGARLRLGSRASRLALSQSHWVSRRLQESGDLRVQVETIQSTGDTIQDRPLSEIGGKGLFTRELDEALLEGRIDLAVHSLKDLPTTFPPGLTLAAVPTREDPRDVLVGPEGSPLTVASLPECARVGTSSLRRRALLKAMRPDLDVVDIRGNVDTRIRKVDEGEVAAVVLASAGLRRLNWEQRISEHLDPGAWIPAPGQGALGVVVRTASLGEAAWRSILDDPASRAATAAERTLLHRLEAGCRLPVGALGLPFGRNLRLRGMVASPDGEKVVRAEGTGRLDDAEALGDAVAERLLQRGADLILRQIRTQDRETNA